MNNHKSNYDIVAHLYSFITGFLYILGGGLTEKAFKKRLFTEFILAKGKKQVLDICCANGKGTKHLASYFKQGKVTGIDLNPAMISFAIKNTKEIPNVNFLVGDCTKMDFPDNSFDFVNSFLALHEIPTQQVKEVLKEIRRVLKDTGSLLVFDFKVPEKSTLDLNFVYYALRLIEDESAARFMMIDQIKYIETFGFKLIYSKEYHNGFTQACLFKTD
ncbi:MAG: class I SAM-dependent methyltransferase [Candidatus Heimdallarchaeota archaeon]|nr:class I SAM-dependent methyltransferase [Candidatus Heimdallarchaeota archaeon]MBY8994246.1 class I SAM-dependent methyltransferase [Candidatus Heimdallarchaeota archaeon]